MQQFIITTFKKIAPLAILLMTFFSAGAQKHGQALIDSLAAALPVAKDDTVKARLLKSIAEQYLLVNADEAMKVAEAGLKHVTQMKWSKGIAVFTNITGQYFVNKGDYKKAIELYQRSYSIHEGNKDYANMASTLNNIGAAYQRQSQFENAIDYLLRSVKIAEENKLNNLTAMGYSNIGIIYSEQSNPTKALDYHFKALKLQEKETDTDATATSLTRIANEYLLLKDSVKAEQFFLKAKQYYEQSENAIGIANVLTNYSILIKDYRKNLEYKLQAQKIWDAVSPEDPVSIANLGNIGTVYLDLVRYDTLHTIVPGGIIPATKNELLAKGEFYLTRAITLGKLTGNSSNYAHFSGTLSELQELNNDPKNALTNFKIFYHLNDSLYSQESKNKIAALESQREIDIRNKEIENKKLQLENQRKKLLLLLATIAFLVVVGGLLFYQSRTRKKTNTTLLQLNNELDEANKVKAKFFAILSHDLRSPVANLFNFLQLQKRNPGLLSAQQIADRENKISTSAQSLLETMESMLLWSKGQMEQFKPELTTVPASKLFIYLQKNFSDTPGINFNFINDGDVEINTDADYLQTIMQNLTANAIKALQQTTAAQITWKAWQETNKIYLSITDNGPGISSEQAKSLFDETHITGTRHGLGLHIIRDLAKAISCSINIIPGEKQGTTFILAL